MSDIMKFFLNVPIIIMRLEPCINHFQIIYCLIQVQNVYDIT